jgi:type II secretory pathway pseudopilin PulG
MASRCRNFEARQLQRGFSYLALMILVAVMALVTATSLQVGALAQRRLAEEELLFVGAEFKRALVSYAATTPPGASRYPRALDDLLRDPRLPGARRHLRRIYVDPIAGGTDWGLIASPDGGIAGVHSLSELEPIKQQGFGLDEAALAGRRSYREWVFGADLPPPIAVR